MAHLIDPLQLRHILTFRSDTPAASFTAEDLGALEYAVEHGPEAAIAAWFTRVEAAPAPLPKSALGDVRAVFARSCRTFTRAPHLETLAFETAVLTLRVQGVVGFEDTRLFFSLLKQIAGTAIPGLEDYLQSEEVNHATNQHRAVGDKAMGDHFRSLAQSFDHAKLPALEAHLFATVEARNTPPAPAEPPASAPEARPSAEPRRGLFSGLRNLGKSIISRE